MEIHEIFRAPVFRRGPDKDGFSLGKRRNLAEVKIAMLFVLHLSIIFQVFGDEWWSFCCPVFSSFGDGLTFPQVSFLRCW